MSGMAASLEVASATVKRYLDPLVIAKYVEMVGKPGRGGGYTYALTTLGHRYLNEHPEELAEEDGPEPELKFNTPSPKPAAEVRQVPARSLSPAEVSAANPETPRPDPIGSWPPQNPPELDELEPIGTPPPQRSPGQEPIHEALYELLYERFADHVTARDLVERMKRKEGDA